VEETIFPRPAVAGELEKLIEARLHFDGARRKEINALQRRMVQSIAAPIYVIVDPKTGEILRRHDGYTTEKQFLELLRGSY
jgi:CRISPR/Cas system endoribonuclease Cas6 (RAMP superfamily)